MITEPFQLPTIDGLIRVDAVRNAAHIVAIPVEFDLVAGQ
jgi:hypothetical protein